MESDHEIAAVVTQPPAPSGRGRKISQSPVHEYAEKHGLTVVAPKSISEAAAELEKISPDCIPVVAYGQLIPADLLSLPALGWVNLHFSLLPSWRGAAPVQHAIWSGDQITGATTFILDSGLDTGPVLGSVTEVIRSDDTSGELLDRLSRTGAVLLRQTIDALGAGALVPKPQSLDGVSYAPKLTKFDSRIDWSLPALEIDRRVRATTPTPGAWTTYVSGEGVTEKIGVGPLRIIQSDPIPCGTVVVERKRVLVGTVSQPVELGTVTPSGRKTMPASDWIRGVSQPPAVFT